MGEGKGVNRNAAGFLFKQSKVMVSDSSFRYEKKAYGMENVPVPGNWYTGDSSLFCTGADCRKVAGMERNEAAIKEMIFVLPPVVDDIFIAWAHRMIELCGKYNLYRINTATTSPVMRSAMLSIGKALSS